MINIGVIMSANSFRFIIFPILISISFIFSAFVPTHDAEKIAKYISVSRAGLTEQQFEVYSTIQYPSNENVLIHIINVTDLGFVMVSADNRAEPLLGYSFNHYFTDLGHPIQFDAMLNDYAKQLNYIIENNITATSTVDDMWEYYLSDNIIIHNSRDVQPLISAVWDQGHSGLVRLISLYSYYPLPKAGWLESVVSLVKLLVLGAEST